MQKPFTTQHEFFFTSADLKNPSFHGLDGAEAGLDASTIGRFRQQLVELGLRDIVLGEVNRQLKAKHVIMTEGHINIIDATPVETA